MCTLAIYVRQFSDLPLVVAANRDEFLDRPASPPTLLAADASIVGGRDLRAGGTWLAVARRGLVAGLLNRRTTTGWADGKRSRGALPLLMLTAPTARAAERLLERVEPDAYNPFNLLVADATDAWVVQNKDGRLRTTVLDAGVHVLTNLDVDDPRCSRVARSHRAFATAGAAYASDGDGARLRAALRTILSDHTPARDPRRPDPLGALCVHAGSYGTRSASLLFLARDLRTAGARRPTGARPAVRWQWRHWFADGPPCSAAFRPALVP
jgi:uncharacterized protein with NRDE domain